MRLEGIKVVQVGELYGLAVEPAQIVEQEVDDDRVTFRVEHRVRLVRRDGPDRPWYEVTDDTKAPLGSPTCPDCGELLNHRPADRRFIEDNRYIECVNGHVWWLIHSEHRELVDPVEFGSGETVEVLDGAGHHVKTIDVGELKP